ncbi:MAG: hypothetical protein ACLFSD_00235 [Salinivenus sp.]
MSGVVTVRTVDGDVTGDTVLFRGDELVVMGLSDSTRVSVADVRSVIAGRPASADVDGGVVA